MAISDNLKRVIRQEKEITPDNMVSLFNEVAQEGVLKFLENMRSGKVQLEDIVDFQRIYAMWMEIQGVRELSGGGGGMLPELRTSEIRSLEDAGIVRKNEDDEKTIDLSQKSNEDLEAIALAIMNASNNANSEGV